MTGYHDEVDDDGGNARERVIAYERWVATVLRPTRDNYRAR